MQQQLESYGYEFNAEYIGGPADGLELAILSESKPTPPEVSCVELHNLIESNTTIGKQFFNGKRQEKIRVGVYMLERDPKEYEGQNMIVYHFIEMINYDEFVQKYGETC